MSNGVFLSLCLFVFFLKQHLEYVIIYCLKPLHGVGTKLKKKKKKMEWEGAQLPVNFPQTPRVPGKSQLS